MRLLTKFRHVNIASHTYSILLFKTYIFIDIYALESMPSAPRLLEVDSETSPSKVVPCFYIDAYKDIQCNCISKRIEGYMT
jgi:hypothetical protein